MTTEAYRPGMVVNLAGENAKIQEGEILRTDPMRNKVMIRFLEGEISTLDAAELGSRATVYQREERTFAPGYQVVFVRNSRGRAIAPLDGGKNAGVRNGDRGEIEELSAEKGQMRAEVRLGDGRRIKVELTRFGPQHIDYGYAVTYTRPK